jgi:hypothetical protein
MTITSVRSLLIAHNLSPLLLMPSPRRFVPALNAALSHAAVEGFDLIAFQSLEVEIDARAFAVLRASFDPHTDLVAGAGRWWSEDGGDDHDHDGDGGGGGGGGGGGWSCC